MTERAIERQRPTPDMAMKENLDFARDGLINALRDSTVEAVARRKLALDLAARTVEAVSADPSASYIQRETRVEQIMAGFEDGAPAVDLQKAPPQVKAEYETTLLSNGALDIAQIDAEYKPGMAFYKWVERFSGKTPASWVDVNKMEQQVEEAWEQGIELSPDLIGAYIEYPELRMHATAAAYHQRLTSEQLIRILLNSELPQNIKDEVMKRQKAHGLTDVEIEIIKRVRKKDGILSA